MADNYGRIAGIYDALAGIVYLNAIKRSQRYLLHFIPEGARVLIVGGGTGWILEALAQQQPLALQIVYVELSEQMMKRSRRRKTGPHKVSFICKAIEEAQLEQEFDVIITPFVLDAIATNALEQVFLLLDQHLAHRGRWLYADFQLLEHKPHHKILLRAMHLFFELFFKLKTKILPDIAPLFQQNGYLCLSSQTFYGDFIEAAVYQKQ